MKVNFTKMQGLGNDFVVIDATKEAFSLTASQIQRMANRRLGVGFDQLLVLELPREGAPEHVDFHYRIFNADGSEVGQCGNGARCIAHFIRERGLSDKKIFCVSTLSGELKLELVEGGKVAVCMGVPRFMPADIPFVAAEEAHLYPIDVGDKEIKLSVVNVGNPHAIIQVDKIDAQEVAVTGQLLSGHERFPQGVNVSFMQLIDPQNIRLRVYERGTGETLACGSAACAAVVAGRRNGILQERVTVSQPGGTLVVSWQGPDAAIRMTGPAKIVFQGEWIS